MTVSFWGINNKTLWAVHKVSFLAVWYLAKHATGRRIKVVDVLNPKLRSMLAEFGMTPSGDDDSDDWVGDRQSVYESVRDRLVGLGWILRDEQARSKEEVRPRGEQ